MTSDVATEAEPARVLRRLPSMDPRLEDLMEMCAIRFYVSKEEVRGLSRVGNVAHARHVFWWATNQLTGLSHNKISVLFGYKIHHTTVLHGVKKIAKHVSEGTLIGKRAKAILAQAEVQL